MGGTFNGWSRPLNKLTPVQNRIVLCMRWGHLYSPEYVNVLYRACCQHIQGAFQFICLTDDHHGIAEGVECYPIPDIGLAPQHYYDGAWPKLTVFLEDLYGLNGRALFIDLDSVICGSLDEMFETKGTLVGIDVGKRWRNPSAAAAPRLGTGVFAFDLGTLSVALAEITEKRDEVIAKDRLEQTYLARQIGDLCYWPRDWVLSFKYHLHRRFGLGLIQQPRTPPSQTKIVAFHGKPRPHELLSSHKKIWGQFPHLGAGPWHYMGRYWTL